MTTTIVKPCDYDIEKLTFNPLLSNKKNSAQTILLPSYNGARSPMMKLPPIDLDVYGIPSKCDSTRRTGNECFSSSPLTRKTQR